MASATIGPSPPLPRPTPATAAALAPLACLNCKTRKKGCDKRLPSCTHCTHRAVYCPYPKPSTGNEVGQSDVPDEKRLLSTASIHHVSGDAQTGLIQLAHPSIASWVMLAPSLPSIIPGPAAGPGVPSEFISVHDIIHHQIYKIMWSYGMYPDAVSEQYFATIHRWLPIISRHRFHDYLVNFPKSARADFSLLLLAMCLMTAKPDSELDSQAGGQEALYVTTKMLFAHVQTHIATSISLIQAQLLIANFEYASGKMDVAYISIGTCARMAFAAALNTMNHRDDSNTGQTAVGEEEKRNVWWGILICERFIVSESDSALRPLATQTPSAEEQLPFDLDSMQQTSEAESIASPNTECITSFGREAQAACLYSGVLQMLQVKECSKLQSELLKLDQSLQAFLKDVMRQCGTTWGLYCGAIAFAIGALFSLHEFILDISGCSRELRELKSTSKAALRTTARLVVDVAHSFNSNIPGLTIAALPPRCSHLVRAAHHLLVTFDDIPDKERLFDICEIRTMLDCLGRRWALARMQLTMLEKEAQSR